MSPLTSVSTTTNIDSQNPIYVNHQLLIIYIINCLSIAIAKLIEIAITIAISIAIVIVIAISISIATAIKYQRSGRKNEGGQHLEMARKL